MFVFATNLLLFIPTLNLLDLIWILSNSVLKKSLKLFVCLINGKRDKTFASKYKIYSEIYVRIEWKDIHFGWIRFKFTNGLLTSSLRLFWAMGIMSDRSVGNAFHPLILNWLGILNGCLSPNTEHLFII